MTKRYDNSRRAARSVSEDFNAERFWSKVAKTERCWLWQAALEKNGYGWCRAFNRITFAHRVAWRLTHGSWPDTLLRHKCDVRNCVNPAHLEQGTPAENVADAVARGRVARGERKSKLTEAQALQIRKRALSGEAQSAIAREFNIGVTAVSRIKTGARWSHLPPEAR